MVIRILNLFASIGGNRMYWNDPEYKITAVEIDEKRANFYKMQFPQDEVIIGDAHQYLLEHFNEYDFIWSSPPCTMHSKLNRLSKKIRYFDPMLWQEIILLKTYAKNIPWIIENVVPYYTPLIPPTIKIDRHLYWSNFLIEQPPLDLIKMHINLVFASNKELAELKHIDLNKLKQFGFNSKEIGTILRDAIEPEVGKYLLEQALKGFYKNLEVLKDEKEN